MKTKIQYPGGLAITIEHEEQLVPQLLEAKRISDESESVFFKDIAIENESLERTAREFETLCEKLEKENTELRDVLKTLRLENFDQGATIDSLKEEIQKLKAQATEIPTRHVSPSQQENFFKKKEKPAPKWSKKPCANCGNLFQPTGPSSSVCPDCKAAADVFAAGNDFTENPE